MPFKKRKAQDAELAEPSSKKQKSSLPPLEVWGIAENPANAGKAFLSIPMELTTEILRHFPEIDAHTGIIHGEGEPVLPIEYLQRPDILRALSQTCVAVRRVFLPLAWENLDLCVTPRVQSTFFKHAGETLKRKSNGLLKNKDLAKYVGVANLVLTRYKTDVVLPALTSCLQSLPNLHTIHVLHAHHTQMTTAIKGAFRNIVLPHVRTVIVPGYGHELLKCCPGVRSVRCIRDNGSKLVTVIAENCKHVEEIRGFSTDEKMMKRIVKAAPNLTTIQLSVWTDDAMIKILSGLKKLTTIEIFTRISKGDACPQDLQKTINDCKAILKAPQASEERRYLRLTHVPVEDWYNRSNRPDITYSEVELYA
ncbi:uncharacterized protein LACBIDRAFT_301341 [Laccaria bicolor S238N-H82]|uniref:Predicted protein n=1 Tax=Laccaria bicolor (strain S238N-H82 / ATCC MYA-4686) TaxID=486041 RepID=B0CNB6_LACBS|nr:uncharacterized protein LACBIDRAFT_301341 [Laccaria bicolor S238N-H82]EDR15901.1 predicted protein [Laccaria bicolor S238N-H82]|eukprot:XP_001874109.1 predicted protein [Laccaria bicolor S238N-H82]